MMLRFDGLYVSIEVDYLNEDEDEDETGENAYRSYFRFYQDGTVISASIVGLATPQEILRWFNKGHPDTPTGTYSLEDNHLRFTTIWRGRRTTTSPEEYIVSIDCEGTVKANGLELHSYSHATQNRVSRAYTFLQAEGADSRSLI